MNESDSRRLDALRISGEGSPRIGFPVLWVVTLVGTLLFLNCLRLLGLLGLLQPHWLRQIAEIRNRMHEFSADKAHPP